MEILLLLGIYLVELLCYQVVLRMLFQVKVTTKKWMVLGAGLPIIIEMLPVDDTAGKNSLITISVIIIMFLSMDGVMVEKGIKLVLTLLVLACIEDIFEYFCERFFATIDEYYMEHVRYFFSKCIALICIHTIYYLKEKYKKYTRTHINIAIYFVIGVIIGLMLFCLSIFNQAKLYLPNNKFVFLCDIVIVTIPISICLLVIFVIYIKNTHERMEQLLETERILKESQVNYYKQSLKKETETRKYRHDMVNHLVYVQETLSRNRIEDAQKYLANILGGFKKIQRLYYMIGNEMVDTIMNYFLNMLPESVKIDINGRCPVILDMEDTDICTIFSNIFQNAVEEIIENDMQYAQIIVEAHKGQQYVEYKIKNSVLLNKSEQNDKNGLPKSHKLDKRNHGIGMMNVKSTVERNHGKFEWNQKDGYFCVDIILPIK